VELALLGAVGVVVGENEAGEQQEKADRGIAVVDDGGKGAEPLWISEVVEDDVEGGKGAQAGERGQVLLFGAQQGRFGGRNLAGCRFESAGRNDLELGAQKQSPDWMRGAGAKDELRVAPTWRPCSPATLAAGLIRTIMDCSWPGGRFRR